MITTREELLADTLQYYCEDVKRRNLSKDDGFYCTYHPNWENTEGCAIGRFLEEDLQLYLDGLNDSGIQSMSNENYNKIPKWMRDLGRDFLTSMQLLHDRHNYWNEFGLTSIGKKEVEIIINRYKLDKSKLERVKHFYETKANE